LGLFSRHPRYSYDEIADDARDASPLELARDPSAWQKKLAAISGQRPRTLGLSAFTLLDGGDLFEAGKRVRTEPALLSRYRSERLIVEAHGAEEALVEVAVAGTLRVLAGHPTVCMRMLLAKPIRLVLVPEGADFRRFGFPGAVNAWAIGLFFNRAADPEARIGLRAELVREKPYLMVHEMTHAVHLMGLTEAERGRIDRFLMPVYRSRRWVEEAVAIYAERAFGARYTEEELAANDLYGKTRREWSERAVFSLFMAELLRP